MTEIAFRPQSSLDLAEIYEFSVRTYGIDAADSYHRGLQAAVMRLATFPESGAIYPGIRPQIRYLAYRRHHIFYDYDGETVWVVRILHHALDAGRLI